MNTQFFPSRTIARNAAKLSGGKVIDNGTNAAPGTRWAVVLPAPELVAAHETRSHLAAYRPATLRLPARARAKKVDHVQDKKGKLIPVTYKRKFK